MTQSPPLPRPIQVASLISGQWHASTGGQEIRDAAYGQPIAYVSSEGVDFAGALKYGREVGGRNLRKLNFHERARLLRSLAAYLTERRAEFNALSHLTGATRRDKPGGRRRRHRHAVQLFQHGPAATCPPRSSCWKTTSTCWAGVAAS